MEWIYKEYEFENRLKNIIWTVGEDYSEPEGQIPLAHLESKYLELYSAATIGSRKKYSQWETVKKYLTDRIKKGYNRNIIFSVEICCDAYTEDKLLSERPGIEDIRSKALEEVMEKYYEIKPGLFTDKIKNALLMRQMEKSISLDSKILNIVERVEECRNSKDILDVLEKAERIYFDFLQRMEAEYEKTDEEKSMEGKSEFDEDSFSSFMNEELFEDDDIYKQVNGSVDGMVTSLLVDSIQDYSKRDDEHLQNSVINVDEETVKNIYKKIESYYGKSYMKKNEVISMEKYLCRNVHEGCRIHFTDGVVRAYTDNKFLTNYVKKQKENNKAEFGKNARINIRHINELKEIITRTLVFEQEDIAVPAERGNLVAARLWRIGRSNNIKVFDKIVTNEKGKYAVDVLLDASGSQRVRQGKIATQGYIIAEALTLAGIPNRVMSFCTFLDYTILRRFTDYDWTRDSNENIFEYYSAGSNRDGLAIKAVAEGLIKREEENKILIVLSDGNPNDVKIGNVKGRTIRGVTSYTGSVAVKDTALEVRKARQKGILVLGVFTGKEEDLAGEKIIYGKDLVYIRDVEKFSTIVGTYIKRIIENY